jgi:hypothetical protein
MKTPRNRQGEGRTWPLNESKIEEGLLRPTHSKNKGRRANGACNRALNRTQEPFGISNRMEAITNAKNDTV